MGRSKLLSNKITPSPSPVQTFSESIMEETIDSAENVINNWWFSEEGSDHCKCTSLFSSTTYNNDARDFFTAVTDLQMAMKFLSSNNPQSTLLVRAHGLIQSAMKRLERELHLILKSNRENLDPVTIAKRCSRRKFVVELEIGRLEEEEELGSSSDWWCDDVKTKKGMDDLRLIADCMISCGYGKEYVKIFKTARRSVVKRRIHGDCDDDHHQLVQKLDWKELDDKIKKWLTSFDYAVNSIFTGERILTDYVFSSSSSIREVCFSEITKDVALSLLNFPQSVTSKCKKSSEKIFRFLDLYESISRNLHQINFIFSYESTSSIRTHSETTLSNLREFVRASLADFGSALHNHKDTSKSSVLNGGVHPLTRYVMNYLSFLADYSDSLVEILNNCPLNLHAPLPAEHLHHRRRRRDHNQEEELHVSDRFAWLILVLLCKLDRKTEMYKEVSQSYLFLANNLQYVVEKVKTSELKKILGDEWVVKHSEKVKQYVSSYERMGWGEVISALEQEDDDECRGISVERDRLKRFNGAFLKVHGKQVGWIIADYDLGDEIRRSLRKKIVPKYRVIYEKYHRKMSLAGGDVDEEEECVVKFAPQDLDNYFSEMLTGSYECTSTRSSSSNGGKSDADTASSWSCKVSPPHCIGGR